MVLGGVNVCNDENPRKAAAKEVDKAMIARPIFATERSAAKLLDMKPSEFRHLVLNGALPPPIVIGGQFERWQVSTLESIVDGTAAQSRFNQDLEL